MGRLHLVSVNMQKVVDKLGQNSHFRFLFAELLAVAVEERFGTEAAVAVAGAGNVRYIVATGATCAGTGTGVGEGFKSSVSSTFSGTNRDNDDELSLGSSSLIVNIKAEKAIAVWLSCVIERERMCRVVDDQVRAGEVEYKPWSPRVLTR